MSFFFQYANYSRLETLLKELSLNIYSLQNGVPQVPEVFFSLLFAAKIERRSGDRDERQKPRFFSPSSQSRLRRSIVAAKNRKKKTSGTQGKNGVTMTPNRRLSTLIFICCFSKSLLIKNWKQTIIVRESRALELASHLSSNTYNTEQSDFAYG